MRGWCAARHWRSKPGFSEIRRAVACYLKAPLLRNLGADTRRQGWIGALYLPHPQSGGDARLRSQLPSLQQPEIGDGGAVNQSGEGGAQGLGPDRPSVAGNIEWVDVHFSFLASVAEACR